MARPLVVKVTAGADDPERCNQGFTVAATAVAAGADVSLWLTGEAAWFGVPGRAEEFALPHAAAARRPARDRPRRRAGHGVHPVRRTTGIGEGDLRDGVRLAGSPSYVEEVLADGVQALVY